MRYVAGFAPEVVCNVLGSSETNRHGLLRRAHHETVS